MITEESHPSVGRFLSVFGGGAFLAVLLLWIWWPIVQGNFGWVVGSPSLMSDQLSWAPVVKRMSEGILFPTHTSLGQNDQGFTYYPYLSLWIAALFVHILGLKWAWFTLSALGGGLSYFLIFKIFRSSLSSLWSTALTLLCLVTFVDLPFRQFLKAIILNQSWPIGLEPLAISHVPFPALSLPLFLGLFFISTQVRRFELRDLFILTAAWGLQAYVHPTNAVVGTFFWLFALFFFLRRRFPNQKSVQLKWWMGLSGILMLLQIPFLLAVLKASGGSGLELESLDLRVRSSELTVSFFYWMAYFVGPLLLTLGLAFLFKIDRRELLYRFWPVVALLMTEFLILFGHKIFGFVLSPHLIFDRFALLFGHIYMYVPLLYFLTKKLPFHHLYGFSPGLKFLREILNGVFLKSSAVALPVICLALVVFGFWNGMKQWKIRQASGPMLERAWKDIKDFSPPSDGKGVLVSDAANFLWPLSSKAHRVGGLLINRFANQVSGEEVILNMALYGQLKGWTSDQFAQFLSPGAMQKGQEVSLSSPELFGSGLGYWYAFHNRESQTQDYNLDQLKSIFESVELDSDLEKWNVNAVQSP